MKVCSRTKLGERQENQGGLRYWSRHSEKDDAEEMSRTEPTPLPPRWSSPLPSGAHAPGHDWPCISSFCTPPPSHFRQEL